MILESSCPVSVIDVSNSPLVVRIEHLGAVTVLLVVVVKLSLCVAHVLLHGYWCNKIDLFSYSSLLVCVELLMICGVVRPLPRVLVISFFYS